MWIDFGFVQSTGILHRELTENHVQRGWLAATKNGLQGVRRPADGSSAAGSENPSICGLLSGRAKLAPTVAYTPTSGLTLLSFIEDWIHAHIMSRPQLLSLSAQGNKVTLVHPQPVYVQYLHPQLRQDSS